MDRDLIFYDGTCGLCHGTVLFLLKRDGDGSRFQYSPLQGETFLRHSGLTCPKDLPNTVVVLTADGQTLMKSAAILHLLRRLGRGWRYAAAMLSLIPRPIRDWGYDLVAAARRRLFKRPEGVCPLVPSRLRPRFLP